MTNGTPMEHDDGREYAQTVVTKCVQALVGHLGRAPNPHERDLLTAAITRHLHERQAKAGASKPQDIITKLDDLVDAARAATERYAERLMADPDVDACEIPAKLDAFVEQELTPIADKAIDLVEEHIAPLKATKH